MNDNILLISDFQLNECVSCRSCSESCPSYRNGGIDPEKTISKIISNEEVTDIWNCLQCHRCTMMCPQNIDVAGMMLMLRQIDSLKGNTPERFKKTASAVSKEGFIATPKGRMEALRKDLGLADVTANEGTLEELDRIMNETEFLK